MKTIVSKLLFVLLTFNLFAGNAGYYPSGSGNGLISSDESEDGKFILKIIADTDCYVSVDLSKKVFIAKDHYEKFRLERGQHYIQAVSVNAQAMWDTIITLEKRKSVTVKTRLNKNMKPKAPVLFVSYQNCDLYVDNKPVGSLHAGGGKKIDLQLGLHKVKAVFGDKVWQTVININSPAQRVVKIDFNNDVAILAGNYIETYAGLNMEMVPVKGGAFRMGNENGNKDQQPEHEVRLRDFYIAKYEVTVAQFEKFVKETGYVTDAEKRGWAWTLDGGWTRRYGVNWRYDGQGNLRFCSDYNYPVVHVSWNDAMAFVKWLREKTGLNYSLPTEAQWEYAAGGGSEHQQWAGTDDSTRLYEYANFCDSLCGWHWRNLNYSDGYPCSAPVGSFKPNLLGLYDMSGNVWEWCKDWYSDDYYRYSPQNDPQGPAYGDFKVYRGGSWNAPVYRCRVSYRGRLRPDMSFGHIGFRVVLLP